MSEETQEFNEEQFVKPSLRKLINKEREVYLDKGGMIKKFYPPYEPGNFYLCDVFIPDEGSIASEANLVDTMERIPRPTKGKK